VKQSQLLKENEDLKKKLLNQK